VSVCVVHIVVEISKMTECHVSNTKDTYMGTTFSIATVESLGLFFGIDSSLQCTFICKYQKLGMITRFIPVCYYDTILLHEDILCKCGMS